MRGPGEGVTTIAAVGEDDRRPPQAPVFDVTAFILRNLHLQPAPALPDIRLYTARPGSRLSRLGSTNPDAPAPYWAYGWAGGTALARHLTDNPELVRDRRVLDLGTGSGIVAIAAAKSGAASVIAADTDPNAIAAATLNASENGVTVEVMHADLLSAAPPAVDLVLVGDLFYEQSLAQRTLAFLLACRAAGIDVLIGDPYRVPLPIENLRCLAEYPVPDFGAGSGQGDKRAGIFTLDAMP
jgi:predicted nicotinamide N-methyase